jgi:hypothetical protein
LVPRQAQCDEQARDGHAIDDIACTQRRLDALCPDSREPSQHSERVIVKTGKPLEPLDVGVVWKERFVGRLQNAVVVLRLPFEEEGVHRQRRDYRDNRCRDDHEPRRTGTERDRH